MGQEPNLEKIFLNLSLLPANYVFAPLAIEEMLPHPIVPPAWSLATEFHFYLLLPLVFLLPRRGLILLFGVAAFIQISAMFFADGWFNSNNFGYRYIFGALTFFLFGYVYSKRRESGFEILARIIWFLYVSLFLIMAPAFGLYDNPQVMEVVLGAVLAWPLVEFALAASLPKAWMQRADSLLGRLAYPIFISHFLSFYFCEKLLGLSSTQQIPYIPVAIAFCLTISYGLLFMQERIDAYRLSRRGFQSMATLACVILPNSSGHGFRHSSEPRRLPG
jgi:peptidoglycan/LPS O-acetylase OafA/YrhL